MCASKYSTLVSNREHLAAPDHLDTGPVSPRLLLPPSPVASRSSGRRSDAGSDGYQSHVRLNDGQRLPPSPQPFEPPFPPPAPPDITLVPEIRIVEPWTYSTIPNRVPPLLPPNPPPAPPSPSTLGLFKSVVKLRDKVISKRYALRIKRQNYSDQHGHTRKARDNFHRLAEAFPRNQCIAQLHDAFVMLEHSDSLLSTLEIEVQNAALEIDLVEDRLIEKEEKLYRVLPELISRMFDRRESFDQHMNDNNKSDSESDELSSASSLPSIVSKYYSKRGEANRLREELFNFEQEHQRQVYFRDVDLSEGLTVEPSEVTFLQSYFQERGEMIKEFSTTKKEAEQLYNECLRTGHNVEVPIIIQYPDIEALDHSNRLSRRIAAAAVTADIGREDVEALIEGQSTEARVSSWLDGVKRASVPRVDSMAVEALAPEIPSQPRTRRRPKLNPRSRADTLNRSGFSLSSEHSRSDQIATPHNPKNKQRSFHDGVVRKRQSDPFIVTSQDDCQIEDEKQPRRIRSRSLH